MEWFWKGIAILGLLASPALLTAQPTPSFTEYPTPTVASGPGAITVGPDGALWFTESANKIGRITIAGAITEYPLPTANSGPSGITTGSDGALWFTENDSGKIGRITTAGAITEYPIPTTSSSPYAIVTGPDGALWFTENTGNNIGRITTTGAIAEYPIPTANGGPNGITMGPDGALWFTEWGVAPVTFGNKIGRVTAAGVITEYPIPATPSNPVVAPYAIAAGPDGALWFTEVDPNIGGNRVIGRLTTAGAFTEYAVPTTGTNVNAITTGPDGALWFTENFGNIGRITTTGNITEYPTPTTGSWPIGIVTGPDGAVWFAENEGSKIGRAALPAATPTISGTPLPPGEVGIAYSTALSASGGTPPYSGWTISSGSLPAGVAGFAGLGIVPSTGVISGIPVSVGTSTFSVTVKDSTGATSAPQTFSIGIAAPLQIFSPNSLSSGTVGIAYPPSGGGGVIFSSTGGWPPQTWSATGLPNGMSMSATGVLSGVPSASSQGVYSPQFTVRDSINATATVSLALTINAPGALQITTSSTLSPGTLGAFYSQTLAVSGGATPYSWSLMSGALPLGLSLSSTGAITGTPTSAGTSSFTARVTDAASSTATQTFSLTITSALTITSSTTLPAGTVGTLYAQTLTASGGVPPYSWSLISGALPAGLTLSSAGAITGTPTAAGPLTFTVRVADSNASTVAQTFSLTIATSTLNFSSALRIAHVVDGSGWQTLFAVVNIDQVAVSYTFQFWDDNGNPFQVGIVGGSPGVLTGTLAPGGSAFAETPGTSPLLLEGWAEVASTGRIGVEAIFRYTNANTPDSQGTINASLSGSSIFMPFDNTGGYVTGIALANTNPTHALTITLNFQTDAGATATGSLTLPAHGHTAFVLPTSYPVTAGVRGSINFTAPTADITVTGFRFTPSLSFTSLGAFQ